MALSAFYWTLLFHYDSLCTDDKNGSPVKRLWDDESFWKKTFKVDLELKRMVMMPQWLSRLWFAEEKWRELCVNTWSVERWPTCFGQWVLPLLLCSWTKPEPTWSAWLQTDTGTLLIALPGAPMFKKKPQKGPLGCPSSWQNVLKGPPIVLFYTLAPFFLPQPLKDPKSTTYL